MNQCRKTLDKKERVIAPQAVEALPLSLWRLLVGSDIISILITIIVAIICSVSRNDRIHDLAELLCAGSWALSETGSNPYCFNISKPY